MNTVFCLYNVEGTGERALLGVFSSLPKAEEAARGYKYNRAASFIKLAIMSDTVDHPMQETKIFQVAP